ncbi:DUF1285 domain-containing protein [Marinobacteraceae bacterium S3BR75-40.1]
MTEHDNDAERFAERIKSGTAITDSHPPVDKWNPDLSGDMDMVIQRDGRWLYKGSPLARKEIVKLFSTILRHDDDGEYYLVTPVEKWRIRVEDAPFVAHSVNVEGNGRDQVIWLTTNVDETVAVGANHPLEVLERDGEPAPYVRVRRNLTALVERNAFYHLVNLAEPHEGGRNELGVWSQGDFWPLGSAE